MQKNGGSKKHIIGEDKKSFSGNENCGALEKNFLKKITREE